MPTRMFKSRDAAEDAYRKASRDAVNQGRALQALYSKAIEWRTAPAGKGNRYKAGLFDRESRGGPKVIVVFESKTNDMPCISVFDAFEWSEYQLRVTGSRNDYESNAIRKLAEWVAETVATDVLATQRIHQPDAGSAVAS